MNDQKIQIALPKKGRLRQPAIDLFKRAGYRFKSDKHLLYSDCIDEPIEFVYLRTIDIPRLVERGKVDAGVTGGDDVLEKEADLSEVINLQYGNCRVCLAGEGEKKYKKLSELEGLRIATSLPNLTRNFFEKKGITVEIIELSGSIEIMIKLKISDLVVDIVETGDTLRQNGLFVYENMGNFNTSLYCKPKLKDDPRILQVKKRLYGVLVAEEYSIIEYNIKKKLLAKAEEVTPGFDAPTISPLDRDDMIAVKVMVEKKKIPKVLDLLVDIGATAIYETEIKNFRP